jgi:hypothetical protein
MAAVGVTMSDPLTRYVVANRKTGKYMSRAVPTYAEAQELFETVYEDDGNLMVRQISVILGEVGSERKSALARRTAGCRIAVYPCSKYSRPGGQLPWLAVSPGGFSQNETVWDSRRGLPGPLTMRDGLDSEDAQGRRRTQG